jgi:hypothetical protein
VGVLAAWGRSAGVVMAVSTSEHFPGTSDHDHAHATEAFAFLELLIEFTLVAVIVS